MSAEHIIPDELFEKSKSALSNGENWVACNTTPHVLDKFDLYFFKTKDEANEFSINNISDYDNYKIIHANSPIEIFQQLPFGIKPDKNLNHSLKNNYIMNENNYDYLKLNVKLLGFGEKQHEELEKNLREGKDSFQLTYKAEVNKKPFEAVLNFRKPENSDMYFLNNYHASLERTNGEKMEQTFYLNKGKGVTAKEAYNLLEGRAVHKELTTKAGEPYKAWIQLDFEKKGQNNNYEVNQFHENYGYDLRSAVGKYAVAELDGGEKENKLMQSLQKGNIQSVTIEKGGTSEKMFIEANPQFKTVNLYDGHLKRVQKEELGQYQSARQMNGKEQKSALREGTHEVKEEAKQATKASLKKKNDEDDSLLPKKRTRRKKGLGLA